MKEQLPKSPHSSESTNTAPVLEMEAAVIQRIEESRPERTARIIDIDEQIHTEELRYTHELGRLSPEYRSTNEDREQRKQSVAVVYSPELGYRARVGTQEISLSKGDILTAHLFGQQIDLPSSAPIEMRQQLVDRVHQDKLASLRDNKLAHEHALDPTHHYQRRDAFDAIARRADNPEIEISPGILAEQMVFAWLNKLSIDGQLPLNIEAVDVVQDVVGKMDFKITISGAEHAHHRGIKVDAADVHQIGIQFTINTNQDAQDRKQKQISSAHNNEVDDLALMTVPVNMVKQVHANWSTDMGRNIPINDRDPRGPTELLPEEIKREIVTTLLRQLPKEVEFSQKKILQLAMKEIDTRKTFSSNELVQNAA